MTGARSTARSQFGKTINGQRTALKEMKYHCTHTCFAHTTTGTTKPTPSLKALANASAGDLGALLAILPAPRNDAGFDFVLSSTALPSELVSFW